MSRTNRAHEYRNLSAKNAVMSGAGPHGATSYKRGNRDAVSEALDTMIRDDKEEMDEFRSDYPEYFRDEMDDYDKGREFLMDLEHDEEAAKRQKEEDEFIMDLDLNPGNITDLD